MLRDWQLRQNGVLRKLYGDPYVIADMAPNLQTSPDHVSSFVFHVQKPPLLNSKTIQLLYYCTLIVAV